MEFLIALLFWPIAIPLLLLLGYGVTSGRPTPNPSTDPWDGPDSPPVIQYSPITAFVSIWFLLSVFQIYPIWQPADIYSLMIIDPELFIDMAAGQVLLTGVVAVMSALIALALAYVSVELVRMVELKKNRG